MIRFISRYKKGNEERIEALTDDKQILYESSYNIDSVRTIMDLLKYESNKAIKNQKKYNDKSKKVFNYILACTSIVGVSALIANPEAWLPIVGFWGIVSASSYYVKTIIDHFNNKKFDETKFVSESLLGGLTPTLENAPEKEKKQEEVIEQDLSDNVLLSVKEEEWTQPVVEKPKTLKRTK